MYLRWLNDARHGQRYKGVTVGDVLLLLAFIDERKQKNRLRLHANSGSTITPNQP